ncbi:PhzF family phenazine biosynthesis protein [Arthrobacter sp. MDT3-44]
MEILRYAAFTDRPDGGNPAGVVLDADDLSAGQMQAIAAELGYAESAFVSRRSPGRATVRYFAPEAEIPFCGHATIATGVALADREGAGDILLSTPVGQLDLSTTRVGDRFVASLVTVEPRVEGIDADILDELLQHLRLTVEELSADLPVQLSFAGNTHPIVPVRDAAVLRRLDYDYDSLKALMMAQGWGATVAVVHRLGPDVFEARNPFPPGGVREDPATGSAAASLGAYLRARGDLTPPSTLTVHQGSDVGRPSVITVDIPPTGGLTVSGGAVPIGA